MHRVAIVGLSLHGTDVAGLEAVRRPPPGRSSAFLRELSDVLGASELVFLATCNRVEVIYAREVGEPPGEQDVTALAGPLAAGGGEAALAERLVQRTGEDAVRHLFRVASSLDSLVLGEDQIIAQVRDAYAASADIGLTGPLLGPLFHSALQIGKRVRTETDLSRHPTSIVNLAVARLAQREDAANLRVGVIGAGEVGALCVRALTGAGLAPAVVANRTPERARLLADDCGGRALGLDALQGGEVAVDALVSATSAPGLVLDAATLDALAARTPSGAPLLAVDLAVPRDLPPATPGGHVEIVDLDALRAIADANRARRAEAAVLAEQLVERKVALVLERQRAAEVGPLVSELQASSREILDRELAGLLGGRLGHLAEGDRRAVERWARKVVSRIMHLPVAALRQAMTSPAPDAERAAGPSEADRESRPC